MSSLTTAENSDALAIVDVSGSITNKITRGDLLKAPLPANSVTTAAIKDGAVTNDKFSTDPGEPGADWQAWTPALSNMTKGNGIVEARYERVGKVIYFEFAFILGSTSSMGSLPSFTLPVAANFPQNTKTSQIGSVYIEDSDTAGYGGILRLNSATQCQIFRYGVSGSNVTAAGISASNPFSWGNGDWLRGYGFYEMANRTA